MQIQSPVESQSDTGEVTVTWLTILTTWASIEDISGAELLKADAAGAEVTTRVRFRYGEGVTPRCRVVSSTRTLEIVHANNVHGRNKEYELLCRESA